MNLGDWVRHRTSNSIGVVRAKFLVRQGGDRVVVEYEDGSVPILRIHAPDRLEVVDIDVEIP